jgi:outer membrane protein
MKIPMFKAILVAAALAIASVSVQAEVKIAIVDLRKVFDGYYKTKDADTKIKEEASALEKTAKGMLEDYKKANEEYKGLVESANDVAVSADEKQKRKKSAEDKLLEIRQLEQQVQSYQRQSEATLMEKRRRMRDTILREIRETVVSKAKTAGYTLVIDTAADSVNQTPIVLYTNGENDLTEELLKQLNANSPAPALGGDRK